MTLGSDEVMVMVSDGGDGDGDGAMHYRLSSIKGVPFRFANFASHFISVQIFQIDFPLILSAYKYFR